MVNIVNKAAQRGEQGPVVEVKEEVCGCEESTHYEAAFAARLEKLCEGHGYTLETKITKSDLITRGKNQDCYTMSAKISCGDNFAPGQEVPSEESEKGK